ncbi:MAG: ATP-dependent Clp protease proteolytic subunit [Microbacterium sp.]|uniref:SDH family Clp fold serine proteinase n=1 Tax=Microbacterium sp. TaxID=51671 RepID=UPI0039E437FB
MTATEDSDPTPPDGDVPPTFVPTPVPAPQPTPAPRIPSKTPLYEAMHAARYFRQSVIKQIEQITATTLICYVAPSSEIDRHDVIAMVDLLHNVVPGSAIDLLLHSPGGSIDAAEKLIALIRKRAGTARVRVIVPDYAKSAATLLALGADAIVMSDSSELGVIDPQISMPNVNGHPHTLSAQSYLDAFNLHATNLKNDPDDPVARLMLSKMDPATVRKLERITTRSRSIAEALLATAMVKDEEEATRIAKELSDTKKWHSHGQMISHEAAAKLGLIVTYLAPHDQLWQLYWRLFCLQLTAADGPIKLFEGSYASLAL